MQDVAYPISLLLQAPEQPLIFSLGAYAVEGTGDIETAL